MVYYIDRLCALYPAFSVNSLTIHRFLITAATVSAKGLSDSFWNNSTYARVGGIKLAELGLLELDFLYRLDWRIVPDPEVLVDYYRGLVGRTEGYVIEGDVNSTSMTRREIIGGDDLSNNDKGFSAHGVTDIRWDEWMRDVADNSTSKNEAGNIS
jgi:Cyclin